jgi:IMP and pyridine-specific 5'-nucleotidase
MTSRYRVEYHMKSHRRDELIEWIKGLLIVPFVLVRELPSVTSITPTRLGGRENTVKERYANVFGDVEGLIDDHSTP